MAGIYIHIPFCKQACHYCDFHFSTNLSLIEQMGQALCSEIILRKNYLEGEAVETIYFGGGTPSVFEPTSLKKILDTIYANFEVLGDVEITLEANPDDLTSKRLSDLKTIGINRLSIGIQTFDDARLKAINRAHSAEEARHCVKQAKKIGFDNLTADLIYALPPADMSYWQQDLAEMINLGLPHISLYGLTIEEKTVFGHWLAKGKLTETPEELAADQYRYAIETLEKAGYQQYEVSNFAKPGFESKHNGAYWAGKKYLGIGPAAHSYNQDTRAFNVANNAQYIKAISNGTLLETVEQLSPIQRINEYILTRLRTKAGIKYSEIKELFQRNFESEKKPVIDLSIREGLVYSNKEGIGLTTDGFMVADEVALRLFYEGE